MQWINWKMNLNPLNCGKFSKIYTIYYIVEISEENKQDNNRFITRTYQEEE